MLGKRARSKKRGAPSVTTKRATGRDDRLEPLRIIDTALIEENEWLRCQQERFRW